MIRRRLFSGLLNTQLLVLQKLLSIRKIIHGILVTIRCSKDETTKFLFL